jgi:hypothetical protein
MNAVVDIQPHREAAGLVTGEVHRYSAVEIRERVNMVQEVMRAVMKEGVHYGKIPGTPKPTLYKPGAEVLCVAFRIAPSYQVEDLGDATTARFRVTCTGVHQVSGLALGSGMGECSSNEEKYKWRKIICAEEFDQTPESMRRVKFGKGKNDSIYKQPQVRTEQADLANTVLKMACKRAHVAMTLAVTAASDMFNQDIEDLPEELRPHDVDEPAHAAQQSTLPEPPAELLVAAKTAAAKGEEAYQKFFADTGKENRKALAAHHDTLKAQATAADRARTVEAEPTGGATEVHPELASMAADLIALAAEDAQMFAASWARLSKATKDQMVAAFPGLKKHADAIEVAP